MASFVDMSLIFPSKLFVNKDFVDNYIPDVSSNWSHRIFNVINIHDKLDAET